MNWIQHLLEEKVVVKGCGEIKTSAYVAITQKLVPVVSSLMFESLVQLSYI